MSTPVINHILLSWKFIMLGQIELVFVMDGSLLLLLGRDKTMEDNLSNYPMVINIISPFIDQHY